MRQPSLQHDLRPLEPPGHIFADLHFAGGFETLIPVPDRRKERYTHRQHCERRRELTGGCP